ncbi:MAG TPA: rhodanese-like domain-containing protein [Anaeromyxobacter sp.]
MISRPKLFFAVLGLVGAGVAAASLRGGPQRRAVLPLEAPAARRVTPAELAGWTIEGRRDFTVVDLRSRAEFQAGHVRGAVSCASCHQDRTEAKKAQAGEELVDLSKNVVLYTQSGAEPVVVPRILHDNPRVLLLSGGYDAWRRDVLAPVDLASVRTDEDLVAARKRDAVRSFFTGEAAAAPPVAKLPVVPVRRTGPHKVGGTAEGC